MIINPYNKIEMYSNEYINHKFINAKLKKLYDNDVLLYDYVKQYSDIVYNEYVIKFQELNNFFDNYNYYTLTSNNELDMMYATNGEYIDKLSGFSGFAGYDYTEMRYIWLICSNSSITSDNGCDINVTISGANATELETVFSDRYDYFLDGAFGGNMKGGSVSMIPIPLHDNQELIKIELNKDSGTGFFQIAGASCVPTRI